MYLKATQPDLNITNPYELDDEQFNAAVDLLKQQKAIVGEYWSRLREADPVVPAGDSVVGTTWQYRSTSSQGAKPPARSRRHFPEEGSTGWSDTWMIASNAAASELHVPLDELHHQPGGECQGDGVLRRGAVERQVRAASRRTRTTATKFHADDEDYFSNVYYWTTPVADCGDDRGEVCKDYSEWTQAWTEIRG